MSAMGRHVSLLFVPGNRPERLDKALATAADIVCVDLEDAVPPQDKDSARDAVLGRLTDVPQGRVAVRINGLRTRAGLADLAALADRADGGASLPAWLLVPMVESSAEIAIVRSVLGAACPALIPLVETVAGLDAAADIGREAGVAALMLGAGDLSAQLGCEFAWEPLLPARGRFVMACAAAGVTPIDVPFTRLGDEAGLAEEAARAKAMGFQAKAVIHPAQVDAINAAFRPGEEEIALAEQAIAAFAAAGGQAVSFNGRMLEAPFMKRFERIAAFRESK